MSGDTDGFGLSPHLLATQTRVPEAEHTGPVYCDGDSYASVAQLRAQYEYERAALPLEVWGSLDRTRVVVLA